MATISLIAKNWQRVYNRNLVARTVPGSQKFSPIPNQKLPIVLDSHTLAIGASSFKAKPTWKLGFWVSMIFKVPGVGDAEHYQSAIPLGLTLLRFPDIVSSYQLKISVPKWHSEMSISVWKYKGLITDPFNDLQLKLSRIESKIDYTNLSGR